MSPPASPHHWGEQSNKIIKAILGKISKNVQNSRIPITKQYFRLNQFLPVVKKL